ncbi:hypothetical protein [Streptomyces endophyticus]|uniref:Integral membrane protein n=1 Tax=Streptomyces endophyticus TaxID=714166 RepID=A0ABU6F2R5_9ACTN|nr:hypothetical protein [Streptomyces endophyticus]MEB8338289.1 hypothetical protein [Streptomyces endophyticus]
MTTGWNARAGRAAVFAAVCVLLTALAHTLMSGDTVPWWALTAGLVAIGGAACASAGRERELLPVVGLAVAAQAVLHLFFSWAQVLAHPAASGGSVAGRWLDHVLCRAPMEPSGMGDMHMGPMPTGSMSDMSDMGAVHAMGAAGHDMSGMSPAGMLTAHLLAAVLSGLWLAYGEQAVFRIARSVVGRLVAPLRPPFRLPTPPHRPRVQVRRARRDRTPRDLLLADTITSRGPPAGNAVA